MFKDHFYIIFDELSIYIFPIFLIEFLFLLWGQGMYV